MSAAQLPPPIEDAEDLKVAVASFMETPEFWRPAIGSGGRYFVHARGKAGGGFGLSKFCYFKGISLPDYIGGLRHHVGGGGKAQKRIARITQRRWIPLSPLAEDVRADFLTWWQSVFPEGRSTERVGIISLDGSFDGRRSESRMMSPEELAKRLAAQSALGEIGERIAMDHELQRLTRAGVKNPGQFVDHVSLRNVAAGYDVWSHAPKTEERFIEVKALADESARFFMTRHEVKTLRALGEAAFLYLVNASDSRAGVGCVAREIRDPITVLEAKASLVPVVFEVDTDFNADQGAG